MLVKIFHNGQKLHDYLYFIRCKLKNANEMLNANISATSEACRHSETSSKRSLSGLLRLLLHQS